MTKYSEFKKKQFDIINRVTFQGYQLGGKELKIRGKYFLPFVRCFCVQDSPDNPCPCHHDIIWIPKISISEIKSTQKTSMDGVNIKEITIDEDYDVQIESVRTFKASVFFRGKNNGYSLDSQPLLDVSDHTKIVKLVMENPFEVIKHLGVKDRKQLSDISATQILEAILKIKCIDKNTASKVGLVIKGIEAVEKSISDLPKSSAKELEEVIKEIESTKSIDELSKVLSGISKNNLNDESILTGVQIAQDFITDGIDSIYSSDFGFYELILEDCDDIDVVFNKKEDAKDVAKSDAAGAAGGAAGGAVAGTVLPGPGTAAGAATGAIVMGVGSSVKEVVSKVLDWLW